MSASDNCVIRRASSVCAAVGAIPVAGRWDYREGVSGGGSFINDSNSFTFACVNTAIGKCVQWGYRPWVTYNGKSLAPYHQTCTRLVRADFCGNGTSYTVDGTPIDLYDNLGLQTDTANWAQEAQWDENGSRCFNPVGNRAALLPACLKPLCGYGDPFWTGGRITTEVQKL